MAKSMLSPTHHFEQISQLIENAHSITDLNVIIKKLIPLPELKKILLNKLSTLKTITDQQNTNNNTSDKNDSTISLHSLYFNSYPFDEIFSDDIICSIIQYLSASKMYHKLPQINKNFNRLMREKPILYQQYKIQVTLSDNMWSDNTKKLFVNVSHELQCIEISSTFPHTFPYNAAIPLNSKIAPDESHTKDATNCNNFIIQSVEDMTKKCPFMWYAIRKWHIITHLSDYDHTVSTPTFHNSSYISHNTPSPVKNNNNNTVTFPDTNVIENNNNKETNICLMEGLLAKSCLYIRSLQIDERIMSASPTGGMFGMYGLYTPRASSNLYLNYNHELNNKKKHIASKILSELIGLNNLIHIEWITDESKPILKTLYFNICKNIVCLELCGTHGYTLLNGQILTNLNKLNVLTIEFDDLRYISVNSTANNNNDDDDEEKDKVIKQDIIVKFPINIEFIQFKNYNHASDIIFDLSECYNIIAMQLTISTKTYTFSNMLSTIKWPVCNNNNNKSGNNYLMECLLIEFNHKSMSPSHDVWCEYIGTLRSNKNKYMLPIKCIRCITNTYSHPMCFKMGSYSYNSYNDSVNTNAETVDHFTYTNLSIKGLGESNEDNTNLLNRRLEKKKVNNIIDINTDGDGILWKQLIYDKYKMNEDSDSLSMDKILTYRKYFAMGIVKWIYHLGRDYGSSTSMNVFDTTESNFIPDISTRLDRSTISNNIIINPQYINEQQTISSSSAVFVVD